MCNKIFLAKFWSTCGFFKQIFCGLKMGMCFVNDLKGCIDGVFKIINSRPLVRSYFFTTSKKNFVLPHFAALSTICVIFFCFF